MGRRNAATFFQKYIHLSFALFLVASLQGARAQNATTEPWGSVLAKAKSEGRITLYTATVNPVATRLIAGFQKLHPEIPVEVLRGPTGQLLSKIEQERASNVEGADVFISTEVAWFKDKAKQGQILKPQGPAASGWPSKYLLDNAVVIAAIEPFVIPYNTSLVKNPPKNFSDLTRPEFKDRLGLTELAATTEIAFYDWLEKTQGSGYLEKLKAQNPKMYVGAQPTSQAIASGEVATAIFDVPSALGPLIGQGAPAKMTVPNPGFGIQYAIGGLSWARHKNAALVFVDYIMSRDGQTAWHGTGETASPLQEIPGALVADSITPWSSDDYPPDVVKRYTEHWNSIFK